eukprot:14471691-Ditylum_brightwellii.AAC.1
MQQYYGQCGHMLSNMAVIRRHGIAAQFSADATNAYAQSPPPSTLSFMRIDDQNADWDIHNLVPFGQSMLKRT